MPFDHINAHTNRILNLLSYADDKSHYHNRQRIFNRLVNNYINAYTSSLMSRQGNVPFNWTIVQKDLLNQIHNNRISCIIGPRGCGISTGIRLYVIWSAISSGGDYVHIGYLREMDEYRRQLELLNIAHHIVSRNRIDLENARIHFTTSARHYVYGIYPAICVLDQTTSVDTLHSIRERYAQTKIIYTPTHIRDIPGPLIIDSLCLLSGNDVYSRYFGRISGGFAEDVRISTTARYQNNFTPPTSPNTGDVRYDPTSSECTIYDGDKWNRLTTSNVLELYKKPLPLR